MAFDPSKLRVLSFDLDDTLWSGKHVILQAEKAMLDWMKVHTPKILDMYSVDQLRQQKMQFIKRNPTLKNSLSQARQIFLFELFSEYNYSDAQEKSVACFNAFYLARQNVTLFSNVLSTLETLKKHYRLISITNGNADIELTGLGQYFELSYNAEDFENPKPHSDIFLAALNQVNIKPSECLHIGDHPNHDMLGAYQVGMSTCWLKDGSRAWDQPFKADIEITHISDLIPGLNINSG